MFETQSKTVSPTQARIRVGERVFILQRGKAGRWTAEFTLNGEHARKSLGTCNRTLAERRARQLDLDLVRGEYRQEIPKVSLGEATTRFVEAKKAEGRARKTIIKYEAEIKAFVEFCQRQGLDSVQELEPRVLDAYRANRAAGREAYTLHNHAIIIKGWLKWLVSRDYLADDPFRKLRLNTPRRRRHWSPPVNVIDTLLAAADDVLAGRLATLAYTGMRVGELRNMQRGDLDLSGNWIYIRSRRDARTKTGLDRRVPIHPHLRPHLEKTLKASAGKLWLFCAAPTLKYPKGDHFINERHLNTQLSRLAERVGVPASRANDGIVIHSFRHFFKTFCLNQGIPQMAVDQWQGHVGDRSASGMYYELSDEASQRLMSKVPFSKSARETAGE